MKHVFIVNPVAGKGKPVKLIEEIDKMFESRSDNYFIETTKYPGHASEIAREYASKGYDRIYSIGGDGTLNEVLNGMAGSKAVLGVVPAGSGNDFIKSLTTNFKDILKRTIEGTEKEIDVGKVNGRYFINISSAGVDSEVAYNARYFKNIPMIPSGFSYILGICKTIFAYSNKMFDITIDNLKFERKSLVLAVANGKYYGGGVKPAPKARLDDGQFDICLVDGKNVFSALAFLPKYFKGKHKRVKGVSFYRGKNIKVESDKYFVINADGEVQRVKEAVFEMLPKAIKIIVPREN